MNARYQRKFVMQFFYGKRRPLSRKRFRHWRRQQQRNAQRMREALADIVTVKSLFQEYLEKLHAAYPHYEPFQ